jgi:hypothetical protein
MKIMIPVLCSVIGCSGGENLDFREDGPATFAVPAELPTPLDILVVLDDTTAMAPHATDGPEPANLGGVLVAIYNGAPDVRIAVTTTTTGTRRVSPEVPSGILQHTVKMSDGTLETSYTGSIGTALASLMSVGASSTEPNAAFASAQSALDGDFVRPGAGVGILLATASDDASADAPASYATAIQGHGNPVLVSAAFLDPASRIDAFLAEFGNRNEMQLPEFNMSGISVFAQLFDPQPNASCLPIEAEQYIDGSALACGVVAAHEGEVASVPRCDGEGDPEGPPCYRLLAEPTCESGRLLILGGPFRMYHPVIEARCD